jgi:hypothetical protein
MTMSSPWPRVARPLKRPATTRPGTSTASRRESRIMPSQFRNHCTLEYFTGRQAPEKKLTSFDGVPTPPACPKIRCEQNKQIQQGNTFAGNPARSSSRNLKAAILGVSRPPRTWWKKSGQSGKRFDFDLPFPATRVIRAVV